MLKKASGRASAAAMSCGDPPAPAPPSRPTPKLTDGGTGIGRPASRLLSTRSLPSLFTVDSTMMSPAAVPAAAELPRNPPCSAAGGGRNNGRSGGGILIGGSTAAAGLAGVLVAEEEEDGDRASYCKNNRRVLLGMRLRVQLPPPPPPVGSGGGGGAGDLLGSPIEFGVKNRDAQLALLSPVQRSPLSSAAARLQQARRRSEVEELAEEDYTCVIARGPNPKMTHIFEDRVVESRAGAGAGGGGGDACCSLSTSSCSVCSKDAALLLKRGERELFRNQWNQGVLFRERAGGSLDSSVKLKP